VKKNLEVHNFSKLQELCVNILIKFFKTSFNLLIRILKTGDSLILNENIGCAHTIIQEPTKKENIMHDMNCKTEQ
jgi:hypothetical protein